MTPTLVRGLDLLNNTHHTDSCVPHRLMNRPGVRHGEKDIFFYKHRKGRGCKVPVCGKMTVHVLPKERNTVAKPDLCECVCVAVCYRHLWQLFHWSSHSSETTVNALTPLFLCRPAWWRFSCRHCWQVEVILGRDWVSVSHGASEGHPEGVALWENSPVLYLPLVTLHAGPTETHPTLFPVLCSPGGAPNWVQESCCTQPGLFHQPEAAWTETWPASKQSTHVFTANVFQESWPSGPKWKTNNVIVATKQACSFCEQVFASMKAGVYPPSIRHSMPHVQSGQEEVWEPLLASCQRKEGGCGRGSHYKPHFFPPSLAGPKMSSLAWWIQPPTPVFGTLYTIWNLVFPPLPPNIKYCFQNKTTIQCWSRRMKPQHCSWSRLWWELTGAGGPHVQWSSTLRPITSSMTYNKFLENWKLAGIFGSTLLSLLVNEQKSGLCKTLPRYNKYIHEVCQTYYMSFFF